MVIEDTLAIVTRISGRDIGRAEILDLETRRIDAAAKKIGIARPAGASVAQRREALLQAKLDLGTDELRRRLGREIAVAGAVARTQARFTRRRRVSVVDVFSPAGLSTQFTDFYQRCVTDNDEAALLRAHPDHFVQRILADGRHEVLETTGGSPLATHFFIDYKNDDVEPQGVITPADPAFDHQLVGVARDHGTVIGGVRHQFRDTADGFHARLTVEFPLPTIGHMIAGHRWHLAIEFSNWIEAAVTA